MLRIRRNSRAFVSIEYLITCLVWLYVSLPLFGLSGDWFYGFDLVSYAGPATSVVFEAWHGGTIPLWDSFSFGGVPFLGRLGSGSLYFPNLIFSNFNVHTALQLSIAFHLLLLSLGFLTFVRFALRLRAPAGTIAGIGALTSGFVAANTLSIDRLIAFSLFPWILFFLEKVIHSTRPWKFQFPLVVTSSLFIFGGHPQFIYVLGFFAVIYLCVRLILEKAWSNVHVLIFSGFFVIGTCSLQLLSTYFLNQSSPLSGPKSLSSLSEIAYVLRPQHLLLGLTGDVFSTNPIGVTGSSEAVGGVGLVIFLLALLSCINWLLTRRNHIIPFLFLMTVLSLALSVGPRWFPFRMLHQYLPGFSSARVPSRLLMIAVVSTLILAAYGVHYVIERSISRIQIVIWLCSLLVGLIVLKTSAFTDPSQHAVRWASLLIFAIGFCWIITQHKRGRHFAFLIFVLVISLEGLVGSTKAIDSRAHLDTPMTKLRSPITDFLQSQGGRSIALTQDKFGDYPYLIQNLRPNTHTLNNIRSIDGYDGGPWVQNRWVAGMKELTNQDFNLYLTARSQMPRPLDARIAANSGIQWVLIDTELGTATDQLKDWDGPVMTWSSIEVWSNPFWNGPKVLSGDLLSNTTSPWIIEDFVQSQPKSTLHAPGQISSYTTNLNGFGMRIENAERSVIIVDQTWHPDWKIEADGRKLSAFPVNELLMGFELESGKHNIIASFKPTWYRPLLGLSMLSMFVSGCLSLASINRERKLKGTAQK